MSVKQNQTTANGSVLPMCCCPACGYKFDAATDAKLSGARPSPDDLTLCAKCGEIMMFNADFSVRVPTVAELNDVQKYPDVWELLTKAQRAIRRDRPLGL